MTLVTRRIIMRRGKCEITMRMQISGPVKYLIIGLCFMAFAVAGIFQAVAAGLRNGQLALSSFAAAGLFLFGVILVWVYCDGSRRGENLGQCAVPLRYNFLVTGYLFFFAGALFLALALSAPDLFSTEIQMRIAFGVLGGPFILIGGMLLFFFFKHRFLDRVSGAGGMSEAAIENKESNIGVIVGAATAGLTLLGLVVAGPLVMILDPSKFWLGFGLTAGGIGVTGLFAVIFVLTRTPGAA
jgi:hypothetical protein